MDYFKPWNILWCMFSTAVKTIQEMWNQANYLQQRICNSLRWTKLHNEYITPPLSNHLRYLATEEKMESNTCRYRKVSWKIGSCTPEYRSAMDIKKRSKDRGRRPNSASQSLDCEWMPAAQNAYQQEKIIAEQLHRQNCWEFAML